jgi:hypothetical protein
VLAPGELPVGAVGVPVRPGVAVLAPGVAAPGAVGVLAPGVVVLGALVPGVAVVGVTAAGLVTVLVAGVVVVSKLPASFSRAAVSTPSDSAATTAIAIIGAFQLEDVARRVRAAAPQRRHHSCSG